MSLHPIMQEALKVAAPDLAQTTLTENASYIDYESRGTLEQVFNVIRGLFRDYPAAGYGTIVLKLRQEGSGDSDYLAYVRRSRSCD